jgi:hypothetical protein
VALMKRHDAVDVDKHLSMFTTFIPTAVQKIYNALYIYKTATCFGLQLYSSGRWLAKATAGTANYFTDVQTQG